MALPTGFDPSTGKFVGVTTPTVSSTHNPTTTSRTTRPSSTTTSYTTTNRNTSSSSNTSSYRRNTNVNWWTRLDDGVKSIGNWIDDIIEPVSGWVVMANLILGAIGLLVFIFTGDDMSDVILRALGSVIIGGLILVGTGILLWVLKVVMKGVRFVFWNIYTLLIAIALCGIIIIKNYDPPTHNDTIYEDVEEIPYETYRVTARVLNVRSTPSKNGQVLGTVKRNDELDVSEINNGFAKIYYRGNDGYVSTQYLEKVEY